VVVSVSETGFYTVWVWEGRDRFGLTVFKFPNNLAYSSNTSCSSGLRLSSPSEVCDAVKFCSALPAVDGSEAMILSLLCASMGRDVFAVWRGAWGTIWVIVCLRAQRGVRSWTVEDERRGEMSRQVVGFFGCRRLL
jgi:hypothetical protein